jgi:para-nitrobenzyl esterase
MDNLKFLNNRPFTPGDGALAKLMSAYWVNFIKTGNPNGDGLPAWPKYDTDKQQVKVFDLNTVNETVPGKGGLDFLLSKLDK